MLTLRRTRKSDRRRAWRLWGYEAAETFKASIVMGSLGDALSTEMSVVQPAQAGDVKNAR